MELYFGGRDRSTVVLTENIEAEPTGRSFFARLSLAAAGRSEGRRPWLRSGALGGCGALRVGESLGLVIGAQCLDHIIDLAVKK